MKDITHALRSFRAAVGRPDARARAAARENLMRHIERSAAEALGARSGRTSQIRRERRLVQGLASSAAVIAALVAAIAMSVGSGTTHLSTAAASLLSDAARTTLEQPSQALAPGEYWYERVDAVESFEWGFYPIRGTIDMTSESWTRFDGASRQRVVFGDDARFASVGDYAKWALTGFPLVGRTMQFKDDSGWRWGGFSDRDLSMPWNVSADAKRALPTDPDELFARIARAARSWEGSGPDMSETMWQTAVTLLEESSTPTPPALRAALYRVMARIPDVEVRGETTDALGRTGVAVGRSSDGAAGQEVVIDPVTGGVLETRGGSWGDPRHHGRITRWTVVASGVVGKFGERP